MVIDLQINNPRRFKINSKRLFNVAKKVISNTSTVSLYFVNRPSMIKYNLKYHYKRQVTDVLSFPYLDPSSQTNSHPFVTPPNPKSLILGDIIICYPVAKQEAVKQSKSTDSMIDFYFHHGLQHLLGHHHQ